MPYARGRMGLYDPAYEHDGCGVACLARLDGAPAHETISRAIETLDNLEHRGAEGADAETGDGAGILTQIPDAFLRAELDFALPPAGALRGRGLHAPARGGPPASRRDRDRAARDRRRPARARLARRAGRHARPGPGRAVGSMPVIRQLLIGSTEPDQDAFERRLYGIRRRAERGLGDAVAFPSFSSRTMVLKGMLSAPQLPRFYPDLCDQRFASALAIVHSRFSTNTFPSWALAHPFRFIAHNGEINTLRGNVNWMRAREHVAGRVRRGAAGDPARRFGLGVSFDAVLELLVLAGRPLAHAVMMMVPEAWEGRDDLPEELRGFYAYHEKLMEPWDGPASITFSDGRVLGAKLDRNGLRPGRWAQTDDGWVVLASETGAMPIEPARVIRRGRLKPGALWIVDLQRGALLADRQVECEIASRRPYGTWASEATIRLEDVEPGAPLPLPEESPERLRIAFGYTREDLDILIGPMAESGKEPTGSMGADAALPALSDQRAVAVLLLQAALRAGHQPGDRLAARGPGDEPDDVARARAGAARRRAAARAAAAAAIAGADERGHGARGRLAAAVGAARRDVADVAGRRGPRGRGRAARRRGGDGRRGGRRHPRDRRPPGRARPRADPVAAGRGRRPPRARAPRAAHARVAGRRLRRAARGPPRRLPGRLRRRRRASLAGRRRDRARTGQGPAEGDVEDGRLDRLAPTAARRSSRRSGSAPSWSSATSSARRRSSAGSGCAASRARCSSATRARTCRPAGCTAGGATASATAGTRRPSPRCSAASGGATSRPPTAPSRHGALRGQLAFRERDPIPLDDVEPATEIMKRFATGAMSLGLDLARGARVAGAGHEPDRRALEHRRGRRGSRPLRGRPALGDQAGRVGALRRHDRLPGQRRRAADQGRAGRQARRGRPAARPQGRRATSAGCATRRPAWS